MIKIYLYVIFVSFDVLQLYTYTYTHVSSYREFQEIPLKSKFPPSQFHQLRISPIDRKRQEESNPIHLHKYDG